MIRLLRAVKLASVGGPTAAVIVISLCQHFVTPVTTRQQKACKHAIRQMQSHQACIATLDRTWKLGTNFSGCQMERSDGTIHNAQHSNRVSCQQHVLEEGGVAYLSEFQQPSETPGHLVCRNRLRVEAGQHCRHKLPLPVFPVHCYLHCLYCNNMSHTD